MSIIISRDCSISCRRRLAVVFSVYKGMERFHMQGALDRSWF
jgi:hypothetical protein